MRLLTETTTDGTRELGSCSRRDFLWRTAACGVPLVAAAASGPAAGRLLAGPSRSRPPRSRRPQTTAVTEPWGRLDKLGDGVWALTSTPWAGDRDSGAWRTVCNGGIIAGRDAVLAVEGFGSIEGAAWLADMAEELAGRRPTHVLLTHVHGDHTSGTAGYERGADPLQVMTTDRTRKLLLDREAKADASHARRLLVPDRILPADGDPTELDLGGRTVRLVARAGHTPSDLTVHIDDPRIVFCGDLLWIRYFPNYVDAIPTKLAKHCGELLSDRDVRYVAGHGPLPTNEDVRNYLGLIGHVGEEARRAFQAGTPAKDAAAQFEIPKSLGDWTYFSPRYPEVAFNAWYRDLRGESAEAGG